MTTLVGTARLGRPCVAIVQRGNTEAVRYLRESFDSRDVVEVRWDGRTTDRRRVGQGVLPERRGRERRRRPPPTWSTRGFVLVPVNGAKATASVEEPVVMVTVSAEARPLPTAMVAVTAPSGARVAPAPVPGPAATAETRPAVRASATPAELARLGQVVVLVRTGSVVLPSFHDPIEGGWRCGRCDAVMTARRAGSPLVHAGEACTACQAEVVRVVQRPWQHVNWLRLAIVAGVVYLTSRAVWPLVSLML